MIGLDIGISQVHKTGGGPSIMAKNGGTPTMLSVDIKSMPTRLLFLSAIFGNPLEQISLTKYTFETLICRNVIR